VFEVICIIILLGFFVYFYYKIAILNNSVAFNLCSLIQKLFSEKKYATNVNAAKYLPTFEEINEWKEVHDFPELYEKLETLKVN
jgi:hypothetical protein